MAIETEYKYLVKDDSYKGIAFEKRHILQGYLSRDPERVVRLRIAGDHAYLTVKGKNNGASRLEFEYPLPMEDAKEIIKLCIPPIIEKYRYKVEYGGHIWEVDEFCGALAPLVTAEIELKSPDEKYSLPSFVGENVTGDPRYYNSNLQNYKP